MDLDLGSTHVVLLHRNGLFRLSLLLTPTLVYLLPMERNPLKITPFWQLKWLGHYFNMWPQPPHCQHCRGCWFPLLKPVVLVCGPADFDGSLLCEPWSTCTPALLLAWGFFLLLP